jgi:ribosomal protein L24
MNTRIHSLLSGLLDEVITEAKSTEYKPKKGDYVTVVRGAMTGECGEVTYVIPGDTMADVKFETGKVARVSTKHLKKEKKK